MSSGRGGRWFKSSQPDQRIQAGQGDKLWPVLLSRCSMCKLLNQIDKLLLAVDVDLLVDMARMRFHRVRRDGEALHDRFPAMSAGEQPQDLSFAGGETMTFGKRVQRGFYALGVVGRRARGPLLGNLSRNDRLEEAAEAKAVEPDPHEAEDDD